VSETKSSSVDSFLHLRIKDPDGQPITAPEQLTPALVTLLHDSVPRIGEYSPDGLAALDDYFAKEPPKHGFKPEYLFEEFIPAIGAYIGEVLKRHVHGVWVPREPVLTSAVRVGNREISVFAEAFRVVYGGKNLTDVFRSAGG
jgi:hypothetical protein